MAEVLPPANPLQNLDSPDDLEIVMALEGYRQEADLARKGGLNPRDAKWEQNLNLYWNRYDFSKKADWQAKEVMPEVPSFVDRFAAAMKEALVASPDGFYTVEDPFDTEGDLADAIKRMTDIWLSTVGRAQNGHTLGFPAVFEEQMKLGALTACSGVVLWKEDVKGGRVAFETVDPRFVWLDHTYRDLYRVRRTELDKFDLIAMAKATTKGGKSVFNLSEIERLITQVNIMDNAAREQMTGSGTQITTGRTPIVMDEYIATVVSATGKVLAHKALMVVANGQFLIRGPEANPYWHGKDWLVYAPLVTAPLSVYGRSYMEDFGSIANTFTELTNLIIDAVRMSAMNAFVLVPSMLANPNQASEGVHPNKVFLLEDGFRAEDFAKNLELGTLDQGAIEVWQAMKSELSEAAGINEVGLGQFAPKGRTSATEISTTQSNSSALVRSVAQTAEVRFVDVVLDLVWKTGMQHVEKSDQRFAMAAGEELWMTLMARRKEIVAHPITFQAHGISAIIAKSQMLEALVGLLQIIAQSPELLAAFMQAVDVNKLLALLFNLSNIDMKRLQLSKREQMIRDVMQMQATATGQPAATGTGAGEMQDVASRMGIAK